MKEWTFYVPLFNKVLPRSPLIELLAKSMFENEEEVRIFSFENEDTDFEKYLTRTIRSIMISDAFKVQIKNFVRN